MNIQINALDSSIESPKGFALFALGFRPFFLAAGVFAVLLMATFLSGMISGSWYDSYFPLPLWHAHEMIFGYAVAVMAGFLLTAVRNWTGLDTVTGTALLLLFLLWLAGRVVLFIPLFPVWLVASVDVVFLPLLALVILRPILKSGQRRNIPVAGLLLLMAGGNIWLHAEMLGLSFGSIQQGLLIGVSSVLMLMSVIGGRVMPFFTERGLPGSVAVKRHWIEQMATPLIALWLFAELLVPNAIWPVVAAFAAALIHLIRLSGWGGMKVWSVPMLWVIYLAYGWLIVGFILRGLAGMEVMPSSVALHAWTAGAIGMFTLGMMARVSLGHTGRPLVAHPFMIVAFMLLIMAVVVRVCVPMLLPTFTETALLISAAGWILAFAIFVWVYAPLLIRTRVDGKAG
jgi:uncharacterized protein involved in response to NO